MSSKDRLHFTDKLLELMQVFCPPLLSQLVTCIPTFKGATDFECIVLSLFCSLHYRNSPDLTIALFYRPPNSCPSLLDSLFTTLCNLNVSVFSNFILLGDFNIDYFCTQSSLFSKLSLISSSIDLTQVVSEPTRVSDHTCTLIDLIFVSSRSQVISCETIPALANSDHYGLHLIQSIKTSKKQSKIPPRTTWRYSDANFVKIADLLDEVDWDSILTGDVDSCWATAFWTS